MAGVPVTVMERGIAGAPDGAARPAGAAPGRHLGCGV